MLGGAVSALTPVSEGIGGFWDASLGATAGASGTSVGASGAIVGALGATVGALGDTVAGLGAIVGELGATVGSLGPTVGSLGATGFALGAVVALGVACCDARCAKHTPGSNPSSMPPAINFLMPFCLRTERKVSVSTVRVSSEGMFDF